MTEQPRIHRHELACHLAGEGTPEQRARIDAALRDNPQLQAWRDELEAEDRLVQSAVPLVRVEDRLTPTSRSKWLWWTAPAVASAMALVMMAREPTQRLKGNDLLGVMVASDRGVMPARDGDTFRPGTQLQLLLRHDGHKWALIAGRDAAGVADVYFSLALEAASPTMRPLPSSLVLDDAEGTECIFAVLADDKEDEMRRVVINAVSDGACDKPLQLPAGWTQDHIMYRKARE
jgi:hypothetical protein